MKLLFCMCVLCLFSCCVQRGSVLAPVNVRAVDRETAGAVLDRLDDWGKRLWKKQQDESANRHKQVEAASSQPNADASQAKEFASQASIDAAAADAQGRQNFWMQVWQGLGLIVVGGIAEYSRRHAKRAANGNGHA